MMRQFPFRKISRVDSINELYKMNSVFQDISKVLLRRIRDEHGFYEIDPKFYDDILWVSSCNDFSDFFRVEPNPGSHLVKNCCHARFQVREYPDDPSLWLVLRFVQEPFTQTWFRLQPVYFKWPTMEALEFYNLLVAHFRECTPEKIGEEYQRHLRELEAENERKKLKKRFRPLEVLPP